MADKQFSREEEERMTAAYMEQLKTDPRALAEFQEGLRQAREGEVVSKEELDRLLEGVRP